MPRHETRSLKPRCVVKDAILLEALYDQAIATACTRTRK